MDKQRLNCKIIQQEKGSSFYQWLHKALLLLLILQITNLTPKALTDKKTPKDEVTKESKNLVKSFVPGSLAQLAGDTVVAQHFPGLNQGRVNGSVRVLAAESGNLNTGLIVTGNLYIPGTPNININGSITYNGTVVGTGNSTPTGHSININSGVSLGHVVTKTNPISISPVAPPPQPQGNVNLSLNPDQPVSSFTNVRDITLNSNYGQLVVPEGTYGNLTANTNAGFTFGVEGQNTTYNLQGLTLNSSAQLLIRGNVTLVVNNIFNLGSPSTIGSQNNPIGLLIRTPSRNLNLNTNAKIYGVIQAPLANVNVNTGALIKGSLVCDRLNLNGGLIDSLVADVATPSVVITQPTTGQVINSSTTVVSGTFQDDSLVTSVKVNGVTATINGNNYTATVPLTNGNNTLTVTATDIFGNAGTATVSVVKNVAGNNAPVVNAGADGTITLPTNNLTLNGTVTDDGLPNPPAQTTITWSAVSTPPGGTVTFSSPNTATTNATFSIAGTYTLQLQASDSILSASDTVVITVNQAQQQNQAPIVSAGADKTITLPTNSVTLDGSVTDDGIPTPPGQVTVSWSKISGSGTVTFSNPASPTTTATFSQAGTYVLRLSASDSALTASDDVTVTINQAQPQNQAPSVNAGQDQTITLPNAVALQGQVSDDGLPNPPAQLSISWTKVEGPGVVNFTNPTGAITQASVTVAGTYTLRLTASDSALSSSDDVVVIFNAAANQAPVVNAGQDQTIVLPNTVTLTATATDDGLPSNNLTVTWSKVTGPGEVSFVTGNALTTNVLLEIPGTYTFRATVSDGQLSGMDEVGVQIKVIPKMMVYSNGEGFDEDELSTQAGDKLIVIRNRTGKDITYVFSQGSQSVSVFSAARSNVVIEATLEVGTATVTAQGHPDWVCTVTVLP